MKNFLNSALIGLLAVGASAAQAQVAAQSSVAPAAPATAASAAAGSNTTPAAPLTATLKEDGKLRVVVGLGASLSSGNSRTSNLSLSANGVRATAADKTTLYASALYASSEGNTTAEQLRLGGRYDYNLSSDTFGFGGLDLERNKPANLSLRGVLGGGLGFHVLRDASTTLDVLGGLAYTSDKYVNATVVGGESRSDYGYTSLLLGEESQHRLSSTTSAWQRLTLYPNLRNRGELRANFGAGVSVAMSSNMNLTVGYGYAYNSDPGVGRSKGDSLLTTGVSVRFD